jgi:serine/threonine-protein kinase RsbW
MNIINNEIEVIISSALDNLDLIQILTDCITNFMNFGEDEIHRISMSVRESVTNAIQHGNKLDVSKKVEICFSVAPDQLSVSVKDQGNGFRVEDLPNPLDADNLLRPSGRGIFYMRTFMDEVEFRSLSSGGTEVYMVKKTSSNSKESRYEDHDTHRG